MNICMHNYAATNNVGVVNSAATTSVHVPATQAEFGVRKNYATYIYCELGF